MNTDEKKDALLRRLIPGPDGQSPVWLYPDGSHRAITRLDVSDINATLASTRAQPVADDAGGDELEQGDYVLATKYGDGDPFDHWCVGFFDRKDGDRYHVNDDKGNPFRLGGFRRVEKISNEYGHFLVENKDRISTKTDKDQVVGSLWDSEISIRAALRQPAAADNRGVDVDALKRAIISWAFEECQPDRGDVFGWLDDNVGSLADYIISKGLLRTTPEDAKVPEPEKTKPRTRQIIVGYYELPYSKRREIAEKLGLLEKIRSVPAHEEVRVIFTAAKESDRLEQLFDFIEAATPQPEHEGE